MNRVTLGECISLEVRTTAFFFLSPPVSSRAWLRWRKKDCCDVVDGLCVRVVGPPSLMVLLSLYIWIKDFPLEAWITKDQDLEERVSVSANCWSTWIFGFSSLCCPSREMWKRQKRRFFSDLGFYPKWRSNIRFAPRVLREFIMVR